MTRERIVAEIDAATAPNKMGPEAALEFLEWLSTDIQCRIDGIKDDMRSKGAGG